MVHVTILKKSRKERSIVIVGFGNGYHFFEGARTKFESLGYRFHIYYVIVMSSSESTTPSAPSQSSNNSTRGVAPLALVQTYDHQKCVERLETAITSHNHIKKVLNEIENLGCQLPADFFVCRTCDFEMTGGFLLPGKDSKTYNPKIILCENKQIDKRMFQNTVLHELIHAYDICRAKIDWNNCKHYACTEIRASSLRSVI